MTDRIVFVDCETTSLSADVGEIWELAMVNDDQTLELMLPVDLSVADPGALRVGRFYERRMRLCATYPEAVAKLCRVRWTEAEKWDSTSGPGWAAGTVARWLDGAQLGGACPWFDAGFLERWLRANGHAPTWSHRLVDVENRVAGVLGLEENPKLSECARLMGLPVNEDRLHTALYDAQLARDVYDAVMSRARGGGAAAA